MKLINKSRGTGKTTQLIYASAITGFRIIAPSDHIAVHIEKMAKNMGLKIPKPMSDIEYRNRKLDGDHAPILIDDVEYKILDEALELYFNTPVVAATMTVPIDDDCIPPTPKPLVYDHETKKIRPLGKLEMVEEIDGGIRFKVRPMTNRDVFHKYFGSMEIYMNNKIHKLEDRLMVKTEDGKDIRFVDWLDCVYVKPKEETHTPTIVTYTKEEVIAALTELLTSMQYAKMESHSDKEVWNNAIGVCQEIIQDKINGFEKAEDEWLKKHKEESDGSN